MMTKLIPYLEQNPGTGKKKNMKSKEGQGSLACCSPWCLKESDMTEQPNNNKGIWIKCGLNNALILVHWRRKWQPTPIVLPEKSPMDRGVVGYSLWGCKELDGTLRLNMHVSVHLLWQIFHGCDMYGSYLYYLFSFYVNLKLF